MQKLFRSFPRKTLLDISGYRQQRKYVGISLSVMQGGSQVPHCLPGFPGQDKAGHSLVIKVPCGKFQIAVLKQVGLGKAVESIPRGRAECDLL